MNYLQATTHSAILFLCMRNIFMHHAAVTHSQMLVLVDIVVKYRLQDFKLILFKHLIQTVKHTIVTITELLLFAKQRWNEGFD